MFVRLARLLSVSALAAAIAVGGLIGSSSGAGAAQVSCTPSAGFNTCVQFTYSGAQQTFTVPEGVTTLDATLLGASSTAPTSGGGQATGTVAVTPGETLTVTVGQESTQSSVASFGGGGPGAGVPAGCTRLCGTGGGGMSALWDGTPNVAANALLVAGGGGGTGGGPSFGGAGGGLSGGTGAGGALGGSQTVGGQGGTSACANGVSGSQFTGGQGAGGTNGGGGGGGGWFGGGGGYCATGTGVAGAGGGGSSYISGPGVTNGATTAGVNAVGADGLVTLQYNVPVVGASMFNWPITPLFAGLALAAGASIVWLRRRRAVRS